MWSSRNRMIMDNDGDDVAFLSGSGESRQGLYGSSHKKDLYERGHVAQCSRCQAIVLTVFIFTIIFLSSLAIAFIRPFTNECTIEDEDYFGPPEPSAPSSNDDDLVDEDYEDEDDFIATNGEPFPWEDIRLPSFIKPIRYDIEVTPNLTTLWVKGIEKMIFAVTEETNFIVFHSKNITITSRTINERLKVERMLEYPKREQIYLETDQYMEPGITYAIRIKFQYKLSDHLEGFYLSKYIDRNGQERRLATTHFEPTYARSAFPCFDEPHLKARFLMTITHDDDMEAYFNTPKREVSEVRGRPNLVRDEFEESVEMSTYLVAFVVCDFSSVNRLTSKRVNVSVIASDDKIDQAQYSLDTAVNLLDYYDEYFGVPYPLAKLDLIAIPDFSAGAMENWGLITYRESALLYSDEESSVIAKQWIAVVIAHELAHQWFGNLVTMKWWNDLWLNEGFASWMEYSGVDHIHPEWHMMDQFFLDVIAPALELDSLTMSHPVTVEVKDPREIEAIFDAISYKKGAAIVHMLEKLVGQSTVRLGLSKYLKRHKYGNAMTGDLWQAIADAWNGTHRNFSLTEMMDTWTLQMGYPIIVFEQQNDTNIYTIRQERFLKAANVNETTINNRREEQSYEWIVPVDYITNLEDFSESFILNKSQWVEVEFPSDVRWFKANINGSGFYRVSYPKENWDALVAALIKDHTIFSAADRTQLINDAFSLSLAGLVNATVPLEMCLYLLKETEFVPLAAALSHLMKWKQLLQESDLIPELNAMIRHIIYPKYSESGWQEKGTHLEIMMHKLIRETAVAARVKEAEDKVLDMFRKLMDKNESVPANFRYITYSSGVRFGDADAWKFAWRMYNTSRIPTETVLWIRALASSNNVYHLKQYLDAALDPSKIRTQDIRTIITEVAANPSGSQVAWRHLQMNWDTYVAKFGMGSFSIGTIIEATTAHFSTEFDYRKVKGFFKNRRKQVGSGRRALDQSIEQILINNEWRNSQEKYIKIWLESKFGKYTAIIE